MSQQFVLASNGIVFVCHVDRQRSRPRLGFFEHVVQLLPRWAEFAADPAVNGPDRSQPLAGGRRRSSRWRWRRYEKDIISACAEGLHSASERTNESVGCQNPQERTDQRGTDLVSDLFDRSVDRAHRDYDAQHGCHDAETGQSVGRFL